MDVPLLSNVIKLPIPQFLPPIPSSSSCILKFRFQFRMMSSTCNIGSGSFEVGLLCGLILLFWSF